MHTTTAVSEGLPQAVPRISMDHRAEIVERALDSWWTVLLPASFCVSVRRLVRFYRWTRRMAAGPELTPVQRLPFQAMVEAFEETGNP